MWRQLRVEAHFGLLPRLGPQMPGSYNVTPNSRSLRKGAPVHPPKDRRYGGGQIWPCSVVENSLFEYKILNKTNIQILIITTATIIIIRALPLACSLSPTFLLWFSQLCKIGVLTAGKTEAQRGQHTGLRSHSKSAGLGAEERAYGAPGSSQGRGSVGFRSRGECLPKVWQL